MFGHWTLTKKGTDRVTGIGKVPICLVLHRLVTGDDDGYIVFWSMRKCLDSECGSDSLSYRSHNTYVEGHTSGLLLVGSCVLLSASGKDGQLTTHDYWRAATRDLDHTDSW